MFAIYGNNKGPHHGAADAGALRGAGDAGAGGRQPRPGCRPGEPHLVGTF